MSIYYIKYYWNKVSLIGTTDSLNREEYRRVKLLNKFAFIIISCGIISSIYSVCNYKIYDLIVIGSVLCLFLSIVYLQSQHKYKAAYLLLHLISSLIISVVMMIFGRESGIEVFYAPLIITLPIFHETWKTRIALFVWMVALLIIAQAYILLGGLSPLSYNVTQVARITGIIVANTCCLVLFAAYMADDKKHQTQTEELLGLLQANNGKLNLVNADLERFAYIASHQLNAPVRTINNFLNLIERELKKYPENPEMKEYLDYVKDSSTEMAMLINEYNNEPEPSVNIYADELGNLHIKDNGIGIDEQYHQRIFGMFSRLHSQDQYRGTGIGLSVCKKIMERHNGEISLDSKVGEGTTFYIRFLKSKDNVMSSKCSLVT